MRRAALALGLLLVLAGCVQTPSGSTSPSAPVDGSSPPTPAGDATETDAPPTRGQSPDAVESPTTAPPLETQTRTPLPTRNPKRDRLGWEAGYAYTDTLAVNATDGLNRSELDAVIARTMARVEHLRRIEFDRGVPVEIVSRATYRTRYANGTVAPALRTFDNVKFEALFLVGEKTDSIARQRENRGSIVLGFYSAREDRIVLVSKGETARVSGTVLAHELVHALQFRRLEAGSFNRSTLDRWNAVTGLIEGDARLIEQRYGRLCADNWSCVSPPGFLGGGSSGDIHFGLYYLEYFPYSEGPLFVERFLQRGGWSRVNDLYSNPPASAEQIVNPAAYPEETPRSVELPEESSESWRVVRPPGRPATATLGQAAIAAMFAYPSWDPRPGQIPIEGDLVRTRPGSDLLRSVGTFDYEFSDADGWAGDTLRAFENGVRTGYVWRIAWDSAADAREFVRGYRELLRYWGAYRVRKNVWRIPEGKSAFADAFSIRRSGDSVTIVNAPSVAALSTLHEPAS